MNPLNERAYYAGEFKNPLLITAVKIKDGQPCFKLAYRDKNGVWDYIYRPINTNNYRIVGRFDSIEGLIDGKTKYS